MSTGTRGMVAGGVKTSAGFGEHAAAGLLGQAAQERFVRLRIGEVRRVGNGEAEGLLRVESVRAGALQADDVGTRRRGGDHGFVVPGRGLREGNFRAPAVGLVDVRLDLQPVQIGAGVGGGLHREARPVAGAFHLRAAARRRSPGAGSSASVWLQKRPNSGHPSQWAAQ